METTTLETTTIETTYRFQVKVPYVYDYLGNEFVTSLAGYKNQVSGWVKESRIGELKQVFPNFEIKLIEYSEYWKNYEKYENRFITVNIGKVTRKRSY